MSETTEPTSGPGNPLRQDKAHQAGRMSLLLLMEVPAAKMGVILRAVLDRSRPIEDREKLVRLAWEQMEMGAGPKEQQESVFRILCGPLHGPALIEWLRSNTVGTLDNYLFPEEETNG